MDKTSKTRSLQIMIGGVAAILFIHFFHLFTTPENSTKSPVTVTQPTPTRSGMRCESADEIAQRSDLRKQRIRDACQSRKMPVVVRMKVFEEFLAAKRKFRVHHATPAEWWADFYLSNKYKFIYCGIGKVATTNFKFYVFNLGNLTTYKYAGGKSFYKYHDLAEKQNSVLEMTFRIESVEEFEDKWKSFPKYVFFRDPLARLVSAWRNKVNPWSKDNYFQAELRKEMVKTLNEHLTAAKQVRLNIRGLPLGLFLQYLLLVNDSSLLDHHFRPQSLIAHVCEIDYNFIGHAGRSLSCEMEYMMKQITGAAIMPIIPKSSDSYNMTTILSSVSPDLVRRVLLKHYEMDYDLFGFDKPPEYFSDQ